MDNAAKALLIAAGVIVGCMLMALGVYFFDTNAKLAKNVYTEQEKTVMLRFNSNFEKYADRSDLTAQDVVSAINYVQENNSKVESSLLITVEIRNIESKYSINQNSTDAQELEFIKRYSLKEESVSDINYQKFSCTLEYDDLNYNEDIKRVSKVIFYKL